MLDVAAIFTLRLRAAWVAKTTVFCIPGVGWLMSLAGYVAVERKSSTSIKKMYASCKNRLQEGWSLIIFPQVTQRSSNAWPS
jgi:1-acyl-sn-glycerol-3-phosphate acyltransferase